MSARATDRSSFDGLARFAGAMYLLQMAAGLFTQLHARGSLYVADSPIGTAANIAGSEQLFRIGIGADVICYLAVLLATWALYVLLRTVDQNLAVLAVMFRLVELALHLGATVASLAALRLLRGGPSLASFDAAERGELAQFAIAMQGTSVNLGFVLLGLGSAVFACLLLRSGYVPRALAVLGIVGSALLATYAGVWIVVPDVMRLQYIPMLPMGLYEVGLGLWLLARGVSHRIPVSPRQRSAARP